MWIPGSDPVESSTSVKQIHRKVVFRLSQQLLSGWKYSGIWAGI